MQSQGDGIAGTTISEVGRRAARLKDAVGQGRRASDKVLQCNTGCKWHGHKSQWRTAECRTELRKGQALLASRIGRQLLGL